MSTLVAWALSAGIGFGLGLWMLVSLTPRLSRPRLLDRVAPYVVDVSPGARERLARRTADPLPVFGVLLNPVLGRARALIGRVLGGVEIIEMRLHQSGSVIGVERFRAQQLTWGVVGVMAGIVLGAASLVSSGVPLVVSILVVPVAGVAGVVLRDTLLQRRASARLARMQSELPTVLEFLTLSLSGGEGITDAVRRVARISRGELAAELAGVIAETGVGVPFSAALRRVERGLALPSFTRCVDQILNALDRGAPLVEVLRAQAQDVREQAARDVLELAGKKEVTMLVPLVFLILPLTILFAIFPAVLVLQTGF